MEKQQPQGGGVESSCAPVLVSMNPAHILDQIYTQQVFLDPHHHFLPQQSRLSHQYLGGGGGAFFPLNFKLGLNEFCGGSNDCKNNGGDDGNLMRESEQCDVPEAPETSLGMLHSWENPEESAIKHAPFWETLPSDVPNKDETLTNRQQEPLEMTPKDGPQVPTCLDSKRRVHFGELEAIYKPLPNQTEPQPETTTTSDIPKKKRRKKSSYDQLMSEFFGNLVKQVMAHQENMHKKFAEVMERMDEERRGREEVWRNQEMAEMEERVASREREKVLAEGREAMIVSYLEKLTGQRINLPSTMEEEK